MGRACKYSNEELEEAVRQSKSVAQVMRMLGIKPAGGSHFHISKRIKALGFDTSHFMKHGHNVGKRLERIPADRILVRRSPSLPRTKAYMLRRALLEVGVSAECCWCGATDEWLGRPLILHVDHIDGDPWNCERGNLRFLCPNCHSQTATYCRKMSSRARAANES